MFWWSFMPRFINDYANLLSSRLKKFNSQCWLINTGWWGGGFGIGERINLSITRKILNKCISNSFDLNNFKKSDYFDLNFPAFLEEENITSLNPIDKWKNKEMYKVSAKNLNKLFKENYSKFVNL